MKKLLIALAFSFILVMAIFILPNVRGVCVYTHLKRDISNLHTIGGLCALFAEDHGGRFPDDWNQLAPYLAEDGTKLFVTSQNRGGAGAMSNVMAWTDYVYIQGTTTAATPSTVVAFLPPSTHSVALVLLADGTVQQLSPAELVRALNRYSGKARGFDGRPQPQR